MKHPGCPGIPKFVVEKYDICRIPENQGKHYTPTLQNCPENTWERKNQSSEGWCKTASMTSQRSYWRDIAIPSGVMMLCFEQLNDIKIELIY